MALSHTNCVHCGIKLRHWRDPKSADTKAHAGKGACTVCAYQEQKKQGTPNLDALETANAAELASLVRQRDRLEADRRARGVPAGGHPFSMRRDNR